MNIEKMPMLAICWALNSMPMKRTKYIPASVARMRAKKERTLRMG
jgi:hypothetical protein